MNKNNKDTKETKENKDTKKEGVKGESSQNAGSAINPPTTKLGVFEEDDYFEEFDDEEMVTDKPTKETIDFKQWQEEWEDEEINDQFEKVLKQEMDAFKTSKSGQIV